MRSALLSLAALTTAAEQRSPPSAPPAPALPPIILDGQFDEWAAHPTVLVDPADAGRGAVDLGAVKVAHDPTSVCFFVELGRRVNLQRLDGRLVLVLDQDGDSATGDAQHGLSGADLIIVFTPPDPKAPAKPGFGVAVRRFEEGVWKEIGPYAQPVAFAPTAASRSTEICIERDARTLAGESFRFALVAYTPAGEVIDRTESVTVPLSAAPASAQPPESAEDPLRRAEGAALRIVAWNVERGGLTSKPEPFARVLRALRPDVLLLTELTDKESAEVIESWLRTHLAEEGEDPQQAWEVLFGAGGGNLRTAVASRLPLKEVPALERITWSDGPDRARDLRSAVALIEVGERRLLAAAIHLKCCGGMNTDEELTRLEEIQALRAALRQASLAGRQPSAARLTDALVIGGDLNLVGSFEPLELLIEGLDVDGTDLAVARALQLDGRTAGTWRDPAQPFTPGILDYITFSDSSLTAQRAFVLDTRDLSEGWLRSHGLEAADTDHASDHLPVVLDLRW
jgi:endonuclease/exonuclease/phosphatase family metal-dependent hydrolase